MRVHCLCLIPHSQMAKQPKICMLLILSHCESLFNPPDWGFPLSSPISFLLNVQMSSIDRTPSPLKPLWPPRGFMLMLWGMTGKSHQRLQVGKEPSSMAGAGKQLGKATFCTGLVSALQWLRKQHCSWADTSCGQWNGSRAEHPEMGGLMGLFHVAWKEIPADKLIFGLVVYLG